MGDRLRDATAHPPRRVPRVGQILDLAPADWRYQQPPGRRLRLRVDRVRDDVSLWYDGDWVWVEGPELDTAGAEVGWLPALVRVDALPHEPPGP